MRAILLAGLGMLVSAGSLTAQEHRAEAKFENGGRVRLDLNVGEFRIVPGHADRIVVTWTGRSADQTHATVEVNGQEATVRARTEQRHDVDAKFLIELPERSDIKAEVSVGDVTVGPFDGSEEVRLGVGDLKVEVPNPRAYREVSAEASIGDVDAGPFKGNTRGWLGKRVNWTGGGDHVLKLRVGTGDLRISGKSLGETM